MIEVVSDCPLRVVTRELDPVVLIVCKATYRLAPGESPLDTEQDEPNEADNHWDDDPRRSLYAPSDIVPAKRKADVVVVGQAFAPDGVPARSIFARILIGEIDKSLVAFADRALSSDGEIHEGPMVARVPLRYERAAGGQGTSNPVGVSADGPRDPFGRTPLPNLQPAGLRRTRRSPYTTPVGFGPISHDWPGRAELRGPVAPRAKAERYAAFDPAFFNVAPPDQQLDQLRPDQPIVLENLHPHHPWLVTRLPGIEPTAFVRTKTSMHQLEFRCDTMWIDTTRGVCTLVWRVRIPIDTCATAPVVVSMRSCSTNPRPPEHDGVEALARSERPGTDSSDDIRAQARHSAMLRSLAPIAHGGS